MKLEEEARKKKALAASRRQSAVAKEQQGRISDLEDQVDFLESQRIEAWERQIATESTTSKKKGSVSLDGGHAPSAKSVSSRPSSSTYHQQGRGSVAAAAQVQPNKQQQKPLPSMIRSQVPIEVAETIIDINALDEAGDEAGGFKSGSFAGSSSSGCKRKRGVAASKGKVEEEVARAVCEVGDPERLIMHFLGGLHFCRVFILLIAAVFFFYFYS